MTELYDASLIWHSIEPVQQKKSFVNLDGHKLGLEIDWELGGLRFFIYKDKKKNQVKKSRWVKLHADRYELYYPLEAMILEWYLEHDHFVIDGIQLGDYTRIELHKWTGHLYYHIHADTIHQLLDKEIVYN